MKQDENLLEIKNLRTYFHTDLGTVKAADDLNIAIKPGHTLGIVGESGSGKSVTSLSIMQLLPGLVASVEDGSSISFMGRELLELPAAEMRKIHPKRLASVRLNFSRKWGFQIQSGESIHIPTRCQGGRSSGS